MNLGTQFLQDFVEQCLRDLGQSLPQLHKAVIERDWDDVREIAHAMRGVAENLGATRLVERCRYIMDLDATRLSSEAAVLTRDLEAMVEDGARIAHAQLRSLASGAGKACETTRPGIPDRR